jgi:hypothetical protein
MPDLLGACRGSVADLRIAYSTTLGYAWPDPDLAAIVGIAAHTFEELCCLVATHSGERAGVRSEPRPDYRTRQLQCQVLADIDIKNVR